MSEERERALMDLTMAVAGLLSVTLSLLEMTDRPIPKEATSQLRESMNHVIESARRQGIPVPENETNNGQ